MSRFTDRVKPLWRTARLALERLEDRTLPSVVPLSGELVLLSAGGSAGLGGTSYSSTALAANPSGQFVTSTVSAHFGAGTVPVTQLFTQSFTRFVEVRSQVGAGVVNAVSPAVAMDAIGNYAIAYVAGNTLDNPTTSHATRRVLGWEPTRPGLIADFDNGNYFRM